MRLQEALRQIHFPQSFERLAAARRRLVFEELFIVSLGVALRRAQVEHSAAATRLPLVPAIEKRIQARLPFQLTPSQAKVFAEIAADMALAPPRPELLEVPLGVSPGMSRAFPSAARIFAVSAVRYTWIARPFICE
jgi:ATP-dependent DNA helicase RecG